MNAIREKTATSYGVNLISISEAARRLNVTRVTLYKWISMGILRTQGHQVIGSRHLYWFDPIYIGRIAALLPKKRNKGFSLLDGELEDKLRRIV